MKIILLEDIKNVGKKGSIVDAKQGYAMFLIKEKKAKVGTEENLVIHNKQEAKKEEEYKVQFELAKEIASKYKNTILNFELLSKDGKHSFGSVSKKEIKTKIEDELKIPLNENSLKGIEKSYNNGEHTLKINLFDNKVFLELLLKINLKK